MKNKHVFPIPIHIPMPEVQQVIFNPPVTIVCWSDGTKTIARCNVQDTFSEEVGLAMACTKKLLHPYENFQECLDKAIRPKKTAKISKATAAPDEVKVQAKKSRVAVASKGGDSDSPNRVRLDELLRMFANGAPNGKIEATIVLG